VRHLRIFCTRSGIAARIILAAVGLICACSVQAAVQVIAISEAPSLANFSGHEIQLRQFDPTLGLLESVNIELRGTGAFIQAFNHPAGTGPHRGLSGQENLTLSLGIAGEDDILSLTQHANHRRLPGHSNGTRIEPITAIGHAVLTSEAQLMEFTGSGLVDLFFSAHDGLGHSSSPGPSLLAGLWAAGADIVVTYNYTAVPECATWLSTVTAILVLVGARKKAFSAGS
jgi:hypothetical protein